MHRKVSRLIILFLLTFFVFGTSIMPAYGEKIEMPQQDKKSDVQEEAPKYIKHVVIIAIDGFENKYFTDSLTPRLVGISKEGINGKVIDKFIQPDIKSQDLALLGNLPTDYSNTQRKSILINGRATKQHLDYGFTTVLNIGSDDLDNPKMIVNAAITQFKKDQPYLTYLTFGSYSSLESEKKNHFKLVDEAIGQFMRMLQQQGLYEYTLFVLAGRKSALINNVLDQQSTDIQLEFPLGIRGPNLNAGLNIPTVCFEDLPVTIFYLTDGKVLKSNGKVLWNVIKTDNFYVVQELLRKRIKDISKERDDLIRQQINWSREKLNVSKQQKVLAQERQGIQKQLAIRDQTIKSLSNKLGLYRWFGFGIICAFLIGYAVQYYLLRKRFLLFS